MHTVPTITGVKLEVYKEDRLLNSETDGYVTDPTKGFGDNLCSGSAYILAIAAPSADKTIGLFRDGQDHYIQQKELLGIPALRHGKFPPTLAQQFMKGLLADRFEDGSMAYGIKIPLRICDYDGPPVNTVHYPENMLVLAQYCRDHHPNPGSPDYVLVWKIALVSQSGKFFLTVQEAYDLMICQNGQAKLQIPRLGAHRQLEQLILGNAPEGFRFCTTHQDPLPSGGDISDLRLGKNEGVVDRWYAARNMGCILTAQGPARVHWSDVPPRPRLRYLVENEKVKFGKLGEPPLNPKNELRPVRKARFELQAFGVEVG